MAASYPSSIVALSTKNDGDTVFAAHVDALQDETIAVETALLSGFQHVLKPLANNTQDIGTSSLKWKDLYLAGNATIGGIAAIGGSATIGSSATIGGLIDASGAAAGQIAFPAAQNASAGVNTLDDYEEGSWTPVWQGSTSQTGQAYGVQAGRYIKIGKLVFVSGNITLSTLGTITGILRLGGFPFTVGASSTASRGGLVFSYFAALGTSVITLSALFNTSTTNADVFQTLAASTAVTNASQATLSATTDVYFSGCYEAAA